MLIRKLPLSVLLLAPLVALGIHACDQAAPVEPELNSGDRQLEGLLASGAQTRNLFVGAWRMTSAVAGDDEVGVGSGLQYIMIFSDTEFTTSVSNDVNHLVCPVQTACEWSGGYTHTLATITVDDSNHPDPAEANEDSHLYAFCGGTMFLLGEDVRLTFQRTGLGR